MVDGGGVKIDIGIETFALAHDLGNALGHLNPLWLAEFLGEFDRQTTKMRCAGIEHFVDAMSNAHDLFLARQFPFHEGIDVFQAADFLQHMDYALIGTTMKRAFERADGGSHGRIKIRQSRDRDARGER